ncbi:MAG: nucleotide exchange factor GrpE [Planctomycetes bacterium]|nr:nucleotide exchange factor GrpE [Planctomycetota bacterium]
MRKKKDKVAKTESDSSNTAQATQEDDVSVETDPGTSGEVTIEETSAKQPAADDRTSNASAGLDVEPEDTVESLQAKVAALEDALLRAKADYQNLQRRTTNERTEAVRYGNAELMRSLLSVADDLERSIAASDRSDNVSAVVDGIRLVHGNFLQALRNHGLEVIEALHRPFDPHVHEAMLQQPSDEHPDGTVIEEIARGYRLRDRVLRPPKVIVAKAVGEQAAKMDPEGRAVGET